MTRPMITGADVSEFLARRLTDVRRLDAPVIEEDPKARMRALTGKGSFTVGDVRSAADSFALKIGQGTIWHMLLAYADLLEAGNDEPT